MTNEDRLDALLDEWETLHDRGHTPTPEQLCRDCPELLEEFRRRVEAIRRMDGFLQGDGASDSAEGLGAIPSSSGRYQPTQFHAAGGLGEIYLAQDKEVGRNVALKRVQPRWRHNPQTRRRFLFEAEVTGRLEHPGVAPVYGLGVDDEGNPYYAMRFIHGRSLREAIDKDPAQQILAQQKLLRSFLSACQTIAYAHQRGVIHRDLKPANIMLGNYGETLVVDWGLAKCVSRSPAASNAVDQQQGERLEPLQFEDDAALETVLGEIKGSPAYMSPEQAAGASDAVGPASDIYSLGATLFALLTGRHPVEGDSLNEILENVKQGRLIGVRQANSRVPRPLASIVEKAMRFEPDQRYASAQDLADDLEHFFADEPVSAHHEFIPEKLMRWTRRNRAWTLAGAVALLIVATVSASAAVVIDGYRRDALRQEGVARQEKDKAVRLAQQNENLAIAERESRRQAERVAEYLVQVFRRPDPEMDGRRVTVAHSLDAAVAQLRDDSSLTPVYKSKLLRAIGSTYDGLGLFDRAVEVHEEALKLRQETINPQAAADQRAAVLDSMTDLAIARQHAGQYSQAIPMFEQVLAELQQAKIPDQPSILYAMSNLGESYRIAGNHNKAIEFLEEAWR